ncbi:MAG: hypothetical protein PVF86_10335, partial [Desulfobacterales bacterium]
QYEKITNGRQPINCLAERATAVPDRGFEKRNQNNSGSFFLELITNIWTDAHKIISFSLIFMQTSLNLT